MNPSVIYRSVYSTRFVSLFYAELEEKGNLFYVNAGHGLQFEQLSDGSDDSKRGISALRALSFSNVGFHFYFN